MALSHKTADPAPARPRSGEKTPPLTVTRPELMSDGSDRQFRAFIHNLLAFSARIETIRAGFGTIIGLTGIQYTILISIRNLGLDGEVSIGAVAEHLHLSGAFVTIEVGKLVKRDLVSKKTDPADRRRVCLKITSAGTALLNSVTPIQSRVNDVLFECLDAADFRRLSAMLVELVTCGDRAVSLLHYLSEEENLVRKSGPGTAKGRGKPKSR